MDRSERTDALHRRVNRWAARIVPLLLIGIVGYTTWVVVVSVGVKYLLRVGKEEEDRFSQSERAGLFRSEPVSVHPPRRVGAGIAIIVLFFVLGVPMAVCYFRVLYTVVTDPGLVRGVGSLASQTGKSKSKRAGRRRVSSRSEKKEHGGITSGHDNDTNASTRHGMTAVQGPDGNTYLDRAAILEGREAAPPGLEEFYRREVFECDIDGLPRWCSICQTWKPDRSHHSSEVGRCVYKMDHFCPWAGGMIAERNFKFFIQFLWYTVFFCAFVLIVLAYFAAEVRREGNDENANWVVDLALAALFLLFSFGIGINSLFFVLVNTTTVDRLAHSSRACNFAVLMPPSDTRPTDPSTNGTAQIPGSHPRQLSPIDPLGGAVYPFATITYPLPSSPSPTAHPARMFAILQAPTGTNPYNLPSKIDNFRTVFGYRVWDWFLPLRQSPCSAHGISRRDQQNKHDHDAEKGADMGVGQQQGMYEVGPVLEKLKRDAGLSGSATSEERGSRLSHRGRHHSHETGKRMKRRRRHSGRRDSRASSSDQHGSERRHGHHRHGRRGSSGGGGGGRSLGT